MCLHNNIYIYKKCHHLLATVKLSVSLSRVPLRQVTVVSVLVIVLDAVTCRVEVKLAFRVVPLTLMREKVNGPRFKIPGGISRALYEVGRVMSGLRHSRELDPNTRQVNITWSPGHVNCLSLFEVSSTLSIVEYRGTLISCLVGPLHRCLQSCVRTRARLGYAAFDVHAIAESIFCHYTVRYTYIFACICMHMLYRGGLWACTHLLTTCLHVRSL